MIELRNYQTDDVAAIRGHYRNGLRSVLYQLPTGGGKTSVATFVADGARRKERTVWFMVHRRELVQQTSDTFRDAGLPHGVIASGASYLPGMRVYVVMIGTVARRLEKLQPPDIIVWDECHHLSAETYRAVFEWAATSTHLGLSATPWRLDGSGLGDFFQAMVCGPTPAWLIEQRFLSTYRLFGTPLEPDMDKVHHVAGDFSRKEIAEIMDRPQLVGDAVDHYVKHALGRCALLFDVSVEGSEKMAEAFRARGIAACHVDAKTDDLTRRRAIRDLGAGELKVITNVDLFGEGVSVNNVSCVIQRRPTESLSLHLQQIGRGLRMYPGKEDCVILDHVGNWRRHGLPDDEREWSLVGRGKGAPKPAVDGVRQCERCFCAYPSRLSQCPECGWRSAPSVRSVEAVAGELEEISRQQAAEAAAREAEERRRMIGRAKTPEEMAALGVSTGQAGHILQARQEKDAMRETLFQTARELAYRTGWHELYRVFSKPKIRDLKPAALKLLIEDMKEVLREQERERVAS